MHCTEWPIVLPRIRLRLRRPRTRIPLRSSVLWVAVSGPRVLLQRGRTQRGKLITHLYLVRLEVTHLMRLLRPVLLLSTFPTVLYTNSLHSQFPPSFPWSLCLSLSPPPSLSILFSVHLSASLFEVLSFAAQMFNHMYLKVPFYV